MEPTSRKATGTFPPLTILIVTVAFFGLGAGAATADSEYWTCGPGESVQAHVVPGGLEVTSIPAGARRLKIRIEQNTKGRGRHVTRMNVVEAPTLPLVIAANAGEWVSALASGKWTKENAYPPLGCPTEPTEVP